MVSRGRGGCKVTRSTPTPDLAEAKSACDMTAGITWEALERATWRDLGHRQGPGPRGLSARYLHRF